ncbi:hypothetical protein OXX80_013749, partial [Metschnikowia pulcherrima]
MPTHINKVEDLTDLVCSDLARKSRLLISVAGVPGAGKSTLVEKVIDDLQKKRKELEQFDDPQEAFRRRGAPFTFNAGAFIDTVRRLRSGVTVAAPSFDHSKKDPQEGDIVIVPEVQVVFIEGNYVG